MLAVTVAWGVLVPKPKLHRVDHQAALDTLARMRHGAGYYPAFRDTFLDLGVRLGGARSFRTPYPFLLWRWVPPGLLFPLFLAVVVLGTCAVLVFCTSRPFLVVPVALFLLVAGRSTGSGGVEGWLLVELWTVPCFAVALLAWNRRRWWPAALALGLAAVIREIYLPFLLLGLVLAWRRRAALKPWVATVAGTAGLLALHTYLAGHFGVAHGNEAPLFGTAAPPVSVLRTMSWAVDWPAWVAIGLWSAAVFHVWRTRPIAPHVALLAIPLVGLVVDRGYWGIPMIALMVLWAGETACDAVDDLRAWRGMSGTSAVVDAR